MNAETRSCPKCHSDLTDAITKGATRCPSCGQEIQVASEPTETAAPAQPLRTNLLPVLRLFLALDGVVLFLLGALLILAPRPIEWAFQFKDLPPGVSYIIGLFGCALLTLGLGYGVAATDPLRHLVWVQVGIARGALECLVGAAYLARGVVTFQQAGFGVIVAAVITLVYLVCYPRRVRVEPAV